MGNWDAKGPGYQTSWDRAAYASAAGSGICRWHNKFLPGSGTLVGTFSASGNDPGIYYDIGSTETVMVTRCCVTLETDSDSVAYEVGYTSGTAGGGTFTPVTPRHYVRSGANRFASLQGATETYYPPLRIAYSAGTAVSVTMRIEANDASAETTIAWSGYKIGT